MPLMIEREVKLRFATAAEARTAILAADAFLIVQGRQHIALDRPVTRIGRRMDNDIVLDLPTRDFLRVLYVLEITFCSGSKT